MESISSLELKDLFHKCPRLKSKLSGQELRAISDTINQRVSIQHSQLLIKIARLEMNQSALDTRKKQLSKMDDKGLPPTKHGYGQRWTKNDEQCKDNVKTSEKKRITFVLPGTAKINNDMSTGDGKKDEKNPVRPGNASENLSGKQPFDQRKVVLGDTFLLTDNRMSQGTKESYKSVKYVTKAVTPSREFIAVGESFENVTPLPLLPVYDGTSNEWLEMIKKKDILIQNLTKENDFIKTVLNERSDYVQILQESVRQKYLINQLKVELETKRKDNVDLMKDIERMRYALTYRDHSCHESKDEKPSLKSNSSKIRNSGLNENAIQRTGYDGKIRCCDSVLISSQYLLVGCGNPSDCPWKKQLASCRSILSKKYQENANLNFMLTQTQDRLSKFKF